MENTKQVKQVGHCDNCDGTDVEQMHWVNVNTKEVGDTISDEPDNMWCNDCQAHIQITYKAE
jgi:hypothetical protein